MEWCVALVLFLLAWLLLGYVYNRFTDTSEKKAAERGEVEECFYD